MRSYRGRSPAFPGKFIEPDGQSASLIYGRRNREELLEFTIGSNHLIPGFETAVVRMEIGEKKI